MSTVSITHDSALSRLATELIAAIPLRLRRWWRGPLNVLRIDERGASLATRRPRQRPTVVAVAPSLVLSKRLVIPMAGRRDLPFAVELLIAQDTPFEPAEVLVDVRLVRTLPETGELAFDVRLIPRDRVVEALAGVRIKPAEVQAISIIGDTRPFGTAGLARRMQRPLQSQWGWLLPIGFAVLAGAACVHFELESGRAAASVLEQQMSTELAALRASLQKFDAFTAEDEGQQATRAAFEETGSTFALLHAARAALPTTTTVSRIQMQAGEFRFFVRTANALQDIRALQEGLGEYDARIDGSVVDAAGGTQSTVFLLTRGSRS